MNSKVKQTTTTEGTTTLIVTTSTTTTTTTTQRTSSTTQPLYRLNSMNGQACILLQVDAIVTVKYKTKLGEEAVRKFAKKTSTISMQFVERDCV